MDFRLVGLDASVLHALHQMMGLSDGNSSDKSLSHNAPTRSYVRDAKAMAATPADVKEYPNSYVFVIDMSGLKSGDIKVQVEDDNVLVISGERKMGEEKEGANYLRIERRFGKFMRKFVLLILTLFRLPTLAQSADKGPDPSSSSGNAHNQYITKHARPHTTSATPVVALDEQRPRPRELQLESSSSTLPVGQILSTMTVMESSKLRKDRVFVLPHSSQSTT
ncbi:unnamed protein product [Vicia faba]|uniref:SHSP domain-containing protein n=1 Tax=Vicia faba TaxID=3906 RepID=A0AAV1A723_VICFA|nr:unnamed protein product [Vicia faba]